MDNKVEFTKARTKRLRKAFDKAIVDGEEDFMFEDLALVTQFAKYMLEFLEPKFGIKHKETL